MINALADRPNEAFAGTARRLSCLAMMSTLAISAPGAAAANENAAAGRISQRILEALIEANGVPGMAASVWRDGAVVWTAGVGYRDLEERLPVEDGTIFRLASASKIFAFTAAARLREQGRLDVDRPVQDSLDYLNPAWPAVTARQLAAHTAGIPHYQTVDEGRGGRHFGSVREAVGVFSDRDLLSSPGAAYRYSSYGYTLLSALVEESAGQPYLDYLAQEITPGLTIIPDATDQGNPAASTAYDYDGGALRRSAPHDLSYSLGGAGLGATAGDLARFGGRLLSGEVVSNATLEWMMEPMRLTDGAAVADKEYLVGFGLRTQRDVDGERVAHHAGVVMGARSVMLLYPERKLAVSILSNAPWISSIEQTAMTLSAPFRAARAGAVARACPLSASRYEGTFGAAPVSGYATFALQDGVCSGRITVDKPMADWFDASSRKDVRSVEIIGLDSRGGFGRAALVTPFGAFDLRASELGGHHIAGFGGTRSLSITFR